jgi:Rps23 Pro-64 3,4-dihydroxylase Tpa1-like proline 4-hydroxylase
VTQPAPLSPQRLEALMDQSIDTLSEILADKTVPAQQRADLALRLLALGMGAGPDPDADPASSGVLAVQFVTVRDFLAPEQHQAIIDVALAEREHFEKSTVTTSVEDYRDSLVLYATRFPALYEMMSAEIVAALPAVLGSLGYPPFAVTRIEMQMTAHGDGAFFKVHDDAASPDTATRALTFVYYFRAREPCGFSGGALRLYQTYPGAPVNWDNAEFREIEPLDNAIVFFDSRLMHEVMPVSVPSGEFADCRFTLNGWLHR